jgi:Fe-S cluster biogenesis protein NfuA
MEAKIRAKLEELRNMLKADGGDLEVVTIEGNQVSLRLKGACAGCPHATQTLKQGIERVLKDAIDPAITVRQAQ